MLEGIREGVQGVSRFIAAGLAIGELSTPSSPARRTHSAAPSSSSSVSTSTTKSTRLSQSSASSFGEEQLIEDSDAMQVLMVYDTGATPTMSPNPAFMQLHDQRDDGFEAHQETSIPSPPATASEMHRRKSRDPIQSSSSTRPSSPSNDPSAKRDATKAKRESISGFPQVSSIPGLGLIAAGANSPPVASWAGSVGKRWEELQRGSG